MPCIKISDAEYPLMEYIWENGPMPATTLSTYSLTAFNWKKNTTYTVLKRLIDRGALRRAEPGFMVYPLVDRKTIQKNQLSELIQKTFAGSSSDCLRTFLSLDSISQDDIMNFNSILQDLSAKK